LFPVGNGRNDRVDRRSFCMRLHYQVFHVLRKYRRDARVPGNFPIRREMRRVIVKTGLEMILQESELPSELLGLKRNGGIRFRKTVLESTDGRGRPSGEYSVEGVS
jgi:hypothetical protein